MEKFVMVLEWNDSIKHMTNEEKGILLQNFYNYHLGEPLDTSNRNVNMMWGILQNNVKRIQDKYNADVAHGKLGGAPVGNQNARKKKNPTEPPTDGETTKKQPLNNPKTRVEQPLNNLKTSYKYKENYNYKEKENVIEKIDTNILGKFYRQYEKEIELIRDVMGCTLEEAIKYKQDELKELDLTSK